MEEVEGGFSAFSVVDRRNVWATGSEGEAFGKQRAVVLHSSDGGLSWKRKLVFPNEHLFGIYFLNARTGWVVGYNGLALRSLNGGKSWIKRPVPTQSTLIKTQFISPKDGWILGMEGELLRTTDGGENWRSYRLKGAGWIGNEFKGWLNSLSFCDGFNGWIAGEHGQAYQSNDGGVTWQTRGKELLRLGWNRTDYDVNFKHVELFPSKLGFMIAEVQGRNNSIAEKPIVVFKTQDCGQTWTVISVLNEHGITGVQFLNEKQIWVAINHGRDLLQSTNGGNTWNKILVPHEVDFPIMYFLDANKGWLVSSVYGFSGTNLYTKDGGNVWTKRKLQYTLGTKRQ